MFEITLMFYNDDTFSNEYVTVNADSIDEAVEMAYEEKGYLSDSSWNYKIENINVVANGETVMIVNAIEILMKTLNNKVSMYKEYFEKNNSEMCEWIVSMDIKRLMSSIWRTMVER